MVTFGHASLPASRLPQIPTCQYPHTHLEASSCDVTGSQDHIKAQNGVVTSKYSYLETERLVTLVGSKLQDLHHKLWHGREGHLALESLASLYGLRALETPSVPHAEPGGSVDSKVGFTFLIKPPLYSSNFVPVSHDATPATPYSSRSPPCKSQKASTAYFLIDKAITCRKSS